MTRTMYDATNDKVTNIPADAEMVGGYVNGKYAWSDADWQRFPTAIHIPITIYIPGQSPPNIGRVLDVEASDAPSAVAQQEAALWCFRCNQRGIFPTLYTSLATKPYLAHIDCDWWLADYTNKPHLLPGPVATQYAADVPPGYDLSLVIDEWPRKAQPVSTSAIFKFIATKSGKGYWIVTADANLYAYGDAGFFGHPDGTPAPLHDFAITPTEQGYWFVDNDANVYAYGDAPFLGHP